MVDIQALGGRSTAEATRTRVASLLLELAGSALVVTVVVAAALSGRLLSTEGGTQEFLLGSLAAAGAIVAIGLAFPGIRANPLLTLLDLIADRVPAADAVGRIVVQVVGGLLGGVLGLWGFYGVHGISFNLEAIDGFHVRDVLVNGVLGGLVLGLVAGAVLARGRERFAGPAIAAVTAAIGLSVDHVTWANPILALGRIVRLRDDLPNSVPLVWVAVTVIGQVVGVAIAAALLRLAATDDVPADEYDPRA